jgi:hypothetical protein
MRTITVCTLTLGLLISGLALASSGTPTKPAATAAAATNTTPPVQIGDEPAAPTAKPAPLVKRTAKVTPKIVSTAGEVTAIDVNKKLLTLKEAKSVANFSISSSTHITLADGKAGHESDVKVGARVTVTYDAHGKTLVAKSVKIG